MQLITTIITELIKEMVSIIFQLLFRLLFIYYSTSIGKLSNALSIKSPTNMKLYITSSLVNLSMKLSYRLSIPFSNYTS